LDPVAAADAAILCKPAAHAALDGPGGRSALSRLAQADGASAQPWGQRGDRVRRHVASLADRIALLAVAASALALVVPSPALAGHSDLLLAVLVGLTAVGIEPDALRDALGRHRRIAVLALGPYVALAAVGVVGHLALGGAAGDGVLALGLSSSEVATVGLVGLAGGDAALALGVLVSSLVLAAVLGPLLAPVLAGAPDGAATGPLLGRFALVVLVPLAAGLLLRAAGDRRRVRGDRRGIAGSRWVTGDRRGIAGSRWVTGDRREIRVDRGVLDRVGAGVVSLLVYAALSGVDGGPGLATAVLGASAFLVAGVVVGAVAGGRSAAP
jgi:hypothetical protein